MTALRQEATIPAYPLGKPADRHRYGMTPEQAKVYRWLVQNRPHHVPFSLNFRDVAWSIEGNLDTVHDNVIALVERGWIEPADSVGLRTMTYRFVPPVMTFNAP